MFKSFQNAVQISFRLRPNGPILVRANNSGIHPEMADITFHRTQTQGKSTVFLAGSGLKGAIRAHAERLWRSHEEHAICTTSGQCERSEGEGKVRDKAAQDLCPLCFTFGAFKLAGRFQIADALPCPDAFEAANRTEVRTTVAIDRKTQSAKTGALFNVEVVTGGAFQVTLRGENFTLWQLGLLAQALLDMDAGFAQIGGCKSRGMGQVHLDQFHLKFRFPGHKPDGLHSAFHNDYRLTQDDFMKPDREGNWQFSRKGLFKEIAVGPDHAPRLFEIAIQNHLKPFLNKSKKDR